MWSDSRCTQHFNIHFKLVSDATVSGVTCIAVTDFDATVSIIKKSDVTVSALCYHAVSDVTERCYSL